MSENKSPRGAGRPARFSREAVVDAAERVVSLEGVDALSMRRVARELGCSPMALYRHVHDRDELLVALLDRLAAEMPRPRLPRDPRKRLLVLFRVLYEGLDQSPWVVQVLVRGDLMAPSVLWLIEEILAAFVAAGQTAEQAADAYLTAWRFTVGELIVSHSTARQSAELDRRPFQLELLAAVQSGELPMLAALADYWPKARTRKGYQARMARILDGLLGDS
ncbi:MAG: TetR/AcrR family transcriptional regulator [Solirubrobacteraceae bacterium]